MLLFFNHMLTVVFIMAIVLFAGSFSIIITNSLNCLHIQGCIGVGHPMTHRSVCGQMLCFVCLFFIDRFQLFGPVWLLHFHLVGGNKWRDLDKLVEVVAHALRQAKPNMIQLSILTLYISTREGGVWIKV